MSDETGGVVLLTTALAIFTIAIATGGRLRTALFYIAVNIFAVSTIFFGFAHSVSLGADIRPYAKFADGIAAMAAAFAVAQLSEGIRLPYVSRDD